MKLMAVFRYSVSSPSVYFKVHKLCGLLCRSTVWNVFFVKDLSQLSYRSLVAIIVLPAISFICYMLVLVIHDSLPCLFPWNFRSLVAYRGVFVLAAGT